MRLTLRTMLAYLDGILEPADRDEIGRKIEESAFATQLMERIGECTRKMRLGAPKLSGKDMGLDPNTVAEYLDNTLAGERVPDFEKVCLESDMHLAEVAACHQILTMVLGQPADVDPASKPRMYDLANRANELPVADHPLRSADEHLVPEHDDGIIPVRHKPQIPDYLRERPIRSRWKTVVAALVLLVLLFGAITIALGPLDRTNPVLRWLGVGPAAENQVAKNNAGDNAAENKPAGENQPGANGANPGAETSAENGGSAAAAETAPANGGEPGARPQENGAGNSATAAAPGNTMTSGGAANANVKLDQPADLNPVPAAESGGAARAGSSTAGSGTAPATGNPPARGTTAGSTSGSPLESSTPPEAGSVPPLPKPEAGPAVGTTMPAEGAGAQLRRNRAARPCRRNRSCRWW